MASRKSPLRDRLLSNSPDPIKSSILRESGMGWSASTGSIPSSGSSSSITSPLRIAKRDSPGRPRGPAVARRTSSSYRHVHTNNLVSKSPFKSQLPTPSTPSSRPPVSFPSRRVSGEKRARPSSMHDQAETENDRPFALKRERKQSKTFQELLDKEPVKKSPFRTLRPTPSTEARPPPPQIPLQYSTPRDPSTPPPETHMQPPAPRSNGPSPARSALVSRRMHGPRLSGGAKRERRKTVTFHERCDVLEFDRDETDDEAFESADEGGQNDSYHSESDDHHSQDDPFVAPPNQEQDQPMEDDASYESIQIDDAGLNLEIPSLLGDPDTSITGIVEEMFFSSNAANFMNDSMASATSTPPRHNDIPTDLETEDGIPFGRSHHVERFLQHHQQPSPHVQPPHFSPHGSPSYRGSPHQQSPSSHPFTQNPPTHASPRSLPATPPRRSPGMQQSTPPLGRSTHMERIRQAREEEREAEEHSEDVNKLPVSPSPTKKAYVNMGPREEGLIPRFDLRRGNQAESEQDRSASFNLDPFVPRLQDESVLSDLTNQNNSVTKDDSMDPANLSVGHSEVNLSSLDSELDRSEVLGTLAASPAPKSDFFPQASERKSPPVSDYHAAIARRIGSPSSRSPSPHLAVASQALTKSASRERISREDVQRRLQNLHRSSPSPALESRSATESPQPTNTTSQSNRRSPSDLLEKERDRMSVLTTQTDFSTETAIVATVEKRNLGLGTLAAPTSETDREFGLLGTGPQLQFDFGSKFSLGGFGAPSVDIDSQNSRDSGNSLAVLTEKPQRPLSIESSSGIKMGDVDVDMDMKSALDRLMEDVAGAGAHPDESMMTDEYEESYDHSRSMSRDDHGHFPSNARPKVMERTNTDSMLLQHNEADGILSRSVSGSSTITLPPPPVPPKDRIKSREQLILEKRREARRADEDMEMFSSHAGDRQSLGVGRPSRRRSMSTGDVEALGGGAKKRGQALLDVVDEAGQDDLLTDSIEKELQKLSKEPQKSKYHVRERETTIYASSSEKISHMAGAGDLDAGRAWRTVRRPSDMNEYAKQIKEYRAQDNGKSYGKVFVKVLGLSGLNLPLPQQSTAFTCTLNNGIHFVTTPECQLSTECRIDQEFELIEHSKLEFTLSLKIRRDPHIIAQFKASTTIAPPPPPPPAPAPVVQPVHKSSGMRSFFSSSPKKSSKEKIVAQPPPPPRPIPQPQPAQRLTENLARYLKPDGTLARAFISFKDIASRCDTRLFETSYPLIGQKAELGGKFSTLEVGEIVLQIFRLPPLPGIPQEQLPQSLEECHRGLRHINWHKVTYFQGTLTQSGGDCSTWRRRQLRVIGSNLVAFNDVTKKATATIDLKKAIAVEDDQSRTTRDADEYDGLYGVERSFRLIFPQSQEILFFADSDEEKARWLEVLRALVGHIPPHPLWAELLWQRQEEMSKRMAAAHHDLPPQSLLQSTARYPQR